MPVVIFKSTPLTNNKFFFNSFSNNIDEVWCFASALMWPSGGVAVGSGGGGGAVEPVASLHLFLLLTR